MAKPGRGRHGRRSPVWEEAVASAFLAVLRETGNAQAAIRAVGHGTMFYRRRREDPAFARRWADCAEAAHFDLRSRRESARDRSAARPVSPPASLGPEPPSLPEPAAKPRPARLEPVIRRNSAGRLQLALPRDGDWNDEVRAAFLAHLRRSGNFVAAARAVGFHFTTVYDHVRRSPDFARDVDEALGEIDARLEYELIACVGALLRRPGEARPEDGDEPAESGPDPDEDGTRFDPAMAMKILAFIDARRGRRRGRKRASPDRPFEEAVASILSKIEAIERHEAMMKEREEKKEGAGNARPPWKGAAGYDDASPPWKGAAGDDNASPPWKGGAGGG